MENNVKYLEVTAYICACVPAIQIIEKKKMLELCRNVFPELTDQEFSNILKVLDKYKVFSGITEKYIYYFEKSSGLPKKSDKEIIDFLIKQEPELDRSLL
jgi:hypothetical protein